MARQASTLCLVSIGRHSDLIAVMRHHVHDGVLDIDDQLARLKAQADERGFRFDRHQARNELQAASFGAGNAEIRLLLARSGAMAVEVRPVPHRSSVQAAG